MHMSEFHFIDHTHVANRQSKCVSIVMRTASNKNAHVQLTSIISTNCLRWQNIDKEASRGIYLIMLQAVIFFLSSWAIRFVLQKMRRMPRWAEVFTKVLQNWNFWSFDWHSSICWCFTTLSVYSVPRINPHSSFLIQKATDNLVSLRCSINGSIPWAFMSKGRSWRSQHFQSRINTDQGQGDCGAFVFLQLRMSCQTLYQGCHWDP